MLLLASLLTATLAAGPHVQQAQAPAPGPTDAQPQPADPDEQKAEAKEPPTPPHTGIRALFSDLAADLKHLPSRRNFAILALGGGLAAAAHPVDQTFNARMRSNYDAVNTAFAPGKYLGGTPEQVALSLGTYAYGRIKQQPKVSHMGMDLLQAQLMAEFLVEPLKLATRRARPDASNRLSFPSGHSAVTFAAATVIERHALGTVAGRAVVHHKADDWALVPVKVPGGVALVVMRAR
jgi:hypothetical protein